MNNDQDIERRKKAFALVLDASSFILKAKGFRIHRIRAVIDALQGAGGGREEFECSHLNLARRLDVGNEKEVTDDAKIRRVQRLLAVLEAEQSRAGKKAFTIIRGGGFEHKKTRYIDNLTELAVLAAKQTQDRMNKENIEPSRFKIILEEESIKNSDYLPDAINQNTDQKEKPMPLDDDLYIQRECNHSVNSFERGLERWLKKGGDADSFLQIHQDRLKRKAENLISKMPGNAKRKPLEFAEVVSLVSSPKNEAEAAETPEMPKLQIESSQSAEPDMMREALNLAEKGFRVFPVHTPTVKGCSCKDGESCGSVGKHPRILDFPNAATTDKEQIKTWWKKWHRANIGIATGKGSNVIVLDVDANKGGNDSFQELFKDLGFPETLTAQTGNGYHLFFQTVEGIDVRNSASEVGQGLDIRGNGGFVVASPSLHQNGKRYSWMNETKPRLLPEHLKEKLLEIEKQRTAQPIVSNVVTETEAFNNQKRKIPFLIREEGDKGGKNGRNCTLLKIAGAMRGKNASYSEILNTLHEVNIKRCIPPMDSFEVEKIALSVMRYPSNQEKLREIENVSASA